MEDTFFDIQDLLKKSGFNVVVGKDAVIEKIIDFSPSEGTQKLCSGYGVFPDGEKCCGCKDCICR